MDQLTQRRIERAWSGAQSWITEFSGAPTAALLVNAPAAAVAPALAHISREAADLRVTVITADKPGQAEFVDAALAAAQVERLLAGELVDLSANWAVQQPAFDLDLHLVVHPLAGKTAAAGKDRPAGEKAAAAKTFPLEETTPGAQNTSPAGGAPARALVSLQLDWWSDQVFSEETDNPAQFAALALYFLRLQALFEAPAVFLSAESGLDPGVETDEWVEL